MTELNETDKYIKCSKCRCKYINSDDSIKKDFGYNRLNEQFKTCVKCRPKSREYSKLYQETHKEEIAERKRDYNKQRYQNNKEEHKAYMDKWREKQQSKEVDEHHKLCKRCSKIQPLTEYGEYNHHTLADGTKLYTPHKTCNVCRDRDKMRRW